ncbi:MAG: 50S ribosomal protein L5 [Candidatus Thermoplasmatota archaeon]|nr:50S ribosomal protein L5 [Candidatus Thermoplasmatota archaeon]
MNEGEARPSTNPMRDIVIDKIVINIGVGEAGEKLSRAEKVLSLLTQQKITQTISRTTNKDLGIREGMAIGCKVTLRKESAPEFLKKALWVKENRIYDYSFDREGNFTFGISDYTDFQGMKYDPDIGIFGMDISVVLKRRGGKRVRNRRRSPGDIPPDHKIGRQEAMDFIKQNFGVEVVS